MHFKANWNGAQYSGISRENCWKERCTKRDDWIVVKRALININKSAMPLSTELSEDGIQVNSTTLRRRLRERGIRGRRRCRSLRLALRVKNRDTNGQEGIQHWNVQPTSSDVHVECLLAHWSLCFSPSKPALASGGAFSHGCLVHGAFSLELYCSLVCHLHLVQCWVALLTYFCWLELFWLLSSHLSLWCTSLFSSFHD